MSPILNKAQMTEEDIKLQYENAFALWHSRKIKTDAELAEALNGSSISFAYHSGNLENEHITYNDTREIFEHDGVTSYTLLPWTQLWYQK